jgi:uncharacterized protein YjiS (DUF1127 family)
MSTAELFGLDQPGRERTINGIGSALYRACDAMRRWYKMRIAIGELRELDDRMLSDIGLSRSTLYSAAREVHGFAESRHVSY